MNDRSDSKRQKEAKCWEAIVVDGAVTPGSLKNEAHQMEWLKIKLTVRMWRDLKTDEFFLKTGHSSLLESV